MEFSLGGSGFSLGLSVRGVGFKVNACGLILPVSCDISRPEIAVTGLAGSQVPGIQGVGLRLWHQGLATQYAQTSFADDHAKACSIISTENVCTRPGTHHCLFQLDVFARLFSLEERLG